MMKRHHWLVGLSALLGFLTALPVLGASTLEEITGLARAGAPQLALRVLDRNQPAAASDPAAWTEWERQRIHIHRLNGQWAAIIERLEKLPPGLPRTFAQWAELQRGEAYLQKGDGASARAVLRELIWEYPAQGQSELFARWRRMVIRSYLAEGRVDDAQTALLRYQQDYGDQGEEWRLLRARVALQGGRSGEAKRVLADDRSAEARALGLLARLREGREDPGRIRDAAEKLARSEGLQDPQRALSWAVAAEAAGQANDLAGRVSALEHALARRSEAITRELLGLDSDTLWDAYADYGLALGNQAQLLVGSDGDWYLAASNAMEDDPLKARALFAVLASTAHDARRRALAHDYFATLLPKEATEAGLLRRLYLNSHRFTDLDSVPERIRYRLTDQALGEGDIRLASRLMADLVTPPSGLDEAEWQMRRARVLILGGRHAQGVQSLKRLLEADSVLAGESLDRFVQVVFDLQTVGRHPDALALFQILFERGLDPKHQREVLFWMAESRQALGEPEQAAQLYLRSATLFDANAFDPWAQTARYHAAQALAEAGLSDDARHLYEGLLNVTQDPARRAVLRHEMQQLWLGRRASSP